MALWQYFVVAAFFVPACIVPKPVFGQQKCLGGFDIYFVLDRSGSVNLKYFQGQTVDFVEKTVENFAGTGVRVSFITFSEVKVTKTVLRLTGDRVKIKAGLNALRKVKPGGGTTLSPALVMANNQIKELGGTQASIIIILTDGRIEDIDRATDQAESFPENLTKLDIRHSSGHLSAFRLISLCLQSLQCLGLSDSLFESLQLDAEKRRVFASLQAVRILEFSYCSSLTDQMVRYIADSCRNLKSLCLRRCNNIQGESLSALIDNCSSLTSLVLDGTSVSDDAVTPVRWERSVITEVDLSWCRHLTQEGLKSMLPRCRLLRYLRLCCCGYGHAITDEVLNAMTQSHCPSLQVLDLSYSSEVTNTALGRFVASCPSLLYLRVYHCQLLTSALMSLIPDDAKVFVVANFFSVQRGGLVKSVGSERPWTLWSAPINYSRTMSLDQSLQQD